MEKIIERIINLNCKAEGEEINSELIKNLLIQRYSGLTLEDVEIFDTTENLRSICTVWELLQDYNDLIGNVGGKFYTKKDL